MHLLSPYPPGYPIMPGGGSPIRTACVVNEAVIYPSVYVTASRECRILSPRSSHRKTKAHERLIVDDGHYRRGCSTIYLKCERRESPVSS